MRVAHVIDIDTRLGQGIANPSNNARTILIDEECGSADRLEVELVEIIDARNHHIPLGHGSTNTDALEVRCIDRSGDVDGHGVFIALSGIGFTVEILDPGGAPVYSTSYYQAVLLAGDVLEQAMTWNTGISDPGDYLVAQTVYQGSTVLDSSTTGFTLRPSSEYGQALTALLLVDPPSSPYGQVVDIGFLDLANVGNMDLSNITVIARIIDPDTLTEVDQVAWTVSSLPIGA